MTTVTMTIGSRRHEGWTQARVTRALETMAGTFRIRLSERAPGEATPRVIRPGEACHVALDGDGVLRGHVDSVRVSYDTQSHTIDVSGRDATGDLVDCSAATRPGEWHDERLEVIAAALAQPFDIPVRAETDTGAAFRRFRIDEGETVFEAIERGCRFRGILPLSDGDGGLVLARPSRSRSRTRLQRGVNLLAASGEASWLERYSDYKLLGQQSGGDFLSPGDAAHVTASATDEGVTRYRPLTLVAEQGLDTAEARERIEWEAVVRHGRSQRVTATVQGWRESPDGPLWAPGRIVRITDDWLGLDRDLLVASVEQALDDGGTLTRMTLMPAQAFAAKLEPEPADPTGFWGPRR